MQFVLGEEASTQARLMKERGDLSKTSFKFHASLQPPAPSARMKGLGMEVVRPYGPRGSADRRATLLIADVDNDPRQATPVAEWNYREERQARRSEDEQHMSKAIRPGDRICAVNGKRGDDRRMQQCLDSAVSDVSPKALQLTLERSRSDVLGPPQVVGEESTVKPFALPPKPPTRGEPNGKKFRRRSHPDVTQPAFSFEVTRPASSFEVTRPGSSFEVTRPVSRASSDVPIQGRYLTSPGPETSALQQWNSMLQDACSDTRGRNIKRWEDEASTRATSMASQHPSVSSGRSSSVSSYEQCPPIVITGARTSQSFSSAGRASVRLPRL